VWVFSVFFFFSFFVFFFSFCLCFFVVGFFCLFVVLCFLCVLGGFVFFALWVAVPSPRGSFFDLVTIFLVSDR